MVMKLKSGDEDEGGGSHAATVESNAVTVVSDKWQLDAQRGLEEQAAGGGRGGGRGSWQQLQACILG